MRRSAGSEMEEYGRTGADAGSDDDGDDEDEDDEDDPDRAAAAALFFESGRPAAPLAGGVDGPDAGWVMALRCLSSVAKNFRFQVLVPDIGVCRFVSRFLMC